MSNRWTESGSEALAATSNVEIYRQQLLEQRESLARRVHSLDQSLDSEVDRDWSEMAASRELEEVNTALERQELADLEAVQAALDRMDRGEFGRCTKCGNQISAARLDALPSAALCAQCQENEEARESGNN